MKILWFTLTPSLYKKSTKGYNGVGWIESLERVVSSESNIQLAVSFFHPDSCFKSVQGATTYYPISIYNSILKKVKHALNYKKSESWEVNAYLKIIADFNPDVIHIFGTEASFGLISYHTNIPVVIHIQGILNPYLNAFFGPGVNIYDIYRWYGVKPMRLLKIITDYRYFKCNARREERILKNCQYFMGRTIWDKNVLSLYAPKARYFHCDEVLRNAFYTSKPWEKKNRDKLFITSTISKTTYKGFDLILKTAKILKDHSSIDFVWNVFGVKEFRFMEKQTGIQCNEVSVILKGIADSPALMNSLLDSDLFVHPSYIDNSPNSVCEAQVLGLPVISTNVGGIPSLIDNGNTGFLIPANDPFSLAAKIIELNGSGELSAYIGKNAREVALKRHNTSKISSDLFTIYKEIVYAKTLEKREGLGKEADITYIHCG